MTRVRQPSKTKRGSMKLATSNSAPRKPLSPRELQVLREMTVDPSSQVIARKLSIHPTTARNHIQNLIRKIGVHSKTQAVAHAFRHGLAGREGARAGRGAFEIKALSPREEEVLRELAHGRTGPEIAKSLAITHTTVRNHVQHILQKLGVHSKTEAVTLAYRRRLVALPAPTPNHKPKKVL